MTESSGTAVKVLSIVLMYQAVVALLALWSTTMSGRQGEAVTSACVFLF